MNRLRRYLHKLDGFQQRHHSTSFLVGVVKKYSDDKGGNLSVQLTYAMFVTVFPLLLLLITALTLVLASDPPAKQALLGSTFSQFPVVGSQLGSNIHVLRRDSVVGLIVGLVVLIYGSTNLASTGLYVMAQVWRIDPSKRPNYLERLKRSLVFLALLGVGLVATTILAGFGTYSRHNLILGIAGEILALVVSIWLYIAAFRALTPKVVKTRDLIPGAIFGGLAWTILQALGGYIVGHYLKNDNATYGVFGSVLGLVAWLYLGAQLTIYAATINSVIRDHSWPRKLF